MVRKVRCLYHVGATRFHLDEVVGPGHVLDLETVLVPGRSRDDGRREADRLMERLGIEAVAPAGSAYIDLLG